MILFLPATAGAAADQVELQQRKKRVYNNKISKSIMRTVVVVVVVGTFVARGETTKSFHRRLFGQCTTWSCSSRRWSREVGESQTRGNSAHY